MRTDLSHWIALSFVQGLGGVHIGALLEKFGSAKGIFAATVDDLAAVEGIGKKTAAAISGFKRWQDVEREEAAACKKGIALVTIHDTGYPGLLKEIHDPPAVLYVRGTLAEDPCRIGIIGSRQPTEYGKIVAERMAESLGRLGVCVVSGMARGIDSIAHRACLAVRSRTIAVLGSGIDIVYPPEHKKLYDEISEHGAVISEFPFGTPPLAENFPRRNRIISGLSSGVLVVEATMKSGSLITARCALEQGREVFAVPGNVLSPKSWGTNNLIKQGAKPVDRVEDILEEVLPEVQRVALRREAPGLSGDEKRVYDFLGMEPTDIDTITAACGFAGSRTSSILTSLEVSGLVRQCAGKRFART